jgi:hypothetical protein
MNVDVHPVFLWAICGPHYGGCGRPDRVITASIIIEIDDAVRRFISGVCCEFIMERLEGGRGDRPLAPCAVPATIPAEMLSMRLISEIAKVEVRVAALSNS